VPIVQALFNASVIFPVPETSLPAVDICSNRSAARMIVRRPLRDSWR
jgi:hypothetical protein